MRDGFTSMLPHCEHRKRFDSATSFCRRFTTACQHSPHSIRYGQRYSDGLTGSALLARFPVPGGLGFSGFHTQRCFGWLPALLGKLTFESRRCMSLSRLLPSARLQAVLSHPLMHGLGRHHRPFGRFCDRNRSALQQAQGSLSNEWISALVQGLKTINSCLMIHKPCLVRVKPESVPR